MPEDPALTAENAKLLRVLVVDDEPTLIESVSRLATIVGGIVVRPLLASGGSGSVTLDVGDFLALAEDDDDLPDLVVCDYDMGLANGVEVIETLRPHYPTVGFAIWSGLDRELPDGIRFIPKDQNAFDGIVAAANAARSDASGGTDG